MRFRLVSLLSMLLVPLFLAPVQARAEVKVVATLPSLASIAKEVGGKNVEVETMSAATEDPHFVDARPNLMVKLNKADLLIANGLELEIGWLPNLQTSARNPKILAGAKGYLDASQHVHRLEVPQAKIDRAQGDLHPGGNPHFLYDPRSCGSIAKAVGERLAELDPAHAAEYRANAAKLNDQMQKLAAEQSQRFAALKPEQRRVVAYHKSLVYLFDWLKLQEVVTVEPRPGIPPDPGHVARVVQTMRTQGTKAILQEEFYPSNTSQTIAKMVSGKVVTLPGGTRFKEGEALGAHLTKLANEVYNALNQ